MLKINTDNTKIISVNNEIITMLKNYVLSFLQVFFMTPSILLFFGALVILTALAQESGVSGAYIGKILYLLFLGNEGHFDDSRTIGVYITYVFIFAFLIEVYGSIFKKKIEIKLKQKLKFGLGFFVISYSMIALWVFVKNGFADSLVIIFFLFLSLVTGAIGISLSHVLGLIKKVNKFSVDELKK